MNENPKSEPIAGVCCRCLGPLTLRQIDTTVTGQMHLWDERNICNVTLTFCRGCRSAILQAIEDGPRVAEERMKDLRVKDAEDAEFGGLTLPDADEIQKILASSPDLQ
jgi:hypothetical protein